jgi:zinc protease
MRKLLWWTCLITLIFWAGVYSQTESIFRLPNYSYFKLKNGFELILIENHTNPLIASVVVVRTGLKNEIPANNGVSHMLEHMTFNGTNKRTQKELYDEIDYFGIYLNAQTSEDYTTYMALNHKDQVVNSLDIMSDMLFSSIFPEDKFEKEKGIIAEEIRRDSENPNFKTDLQIREAFYKLPPYSLPVIGTVETVKQMTRKMVIDYYHQFYSPNNMIAIVIGDFDKEEMLKLYTKYFGSRESSVIQQKTSSYQWEFPFVHTIKNEKEQKIILRLPSPVFHSDYFFPFQFLYKIALEDENSEILKNLKNNPALKIKKIESGYEYHPGFAFLSLQISTDPQTDPQTVKESVLEELEKFKNFSLSPERIGVLKKEEAISQILQTDQILYYGFLKAQELSIGGFDGFVKTTPALLETDLSFISDFINSYPELWDNTKILYTPGNWTKKINLKKYQKPPSVVKSGESRFYKKVNNNGLTIIHLQNRDSDILAIHCLFKNRSAWEPPGKTGIADFLHHSLFKLTQNYSEEELEQKLKQIGAEVKSYDWDFIPYDDYYNVPQYSYIRFVTLDQFFTTAIELLADNIIFPVLDKNFSDVKNQMIKLSGLTVGSAATHSQHEFDKMVMGTVHPLTLPVSGTPQTIENITQEDLKQFHQNYFSAGNIILTLVSSLDSATIFDNIEKSFWGLPSTKSIPDIPIFPVTEDTRKDSAQIGNRQAYIHYGYALSIDKGDLSPIILMNQMLNDNIVFKLREEEGWAYRLGSNLFTWKDHAVLDINLGTGIETIKPAIKGIRDVITDFQKNKITEEQLQKTKNSILAALARRRASRESQAFTIGLNEFTGLDPEAFFNIYPKIQQVSLEQTINAKQKYLKLEPFVLFFTIPTETNSIKNQMHTMPMMKND